VRVRGTTKVVEISKKIQERRLQWYEHIMWRTNDYVVRRVMAMEVEGKRGRWRPRRKWMDRVKKDVGEKGLSGEKVQDRALWRRLIRNVGGKRLRERRLSFNSVSTDSRTTLFRDVGFVFLRVICVSILLSTLQRLTFL